MSSSDFFISEHKFKEICEVINGRAYKKDELLGSGKYKVLRVGNFFTSDNWYYSDLELNNDKYCHKGDLLYAWSASFGPKIWNEDNTIFHYHIWKLVPSDIVNKMFLYYWLEDNKRIILGNLHGSVMGHLTKNAFENQKINLPPLPEQKAIAHILSTLDEKIEVNNQINKTLENIAQTIFKQWFVDFEFPNGAGEPYKSSGGEMVESELGMIPKGWEVKSLDDVADFLNGLAMQKYPPINDKDSFPVLKIKELRQGFTDDNSDICSNMIDEKYVINDGDLIFSWSGSLMVDFWCGEKCGLNQHLFKVTSEKYNKWFYYLWTKHHLNKFIEIAKSKATTMGHIKRKDLTDSKVIVPANKEFHKIENIVQPIIENMIYKNIENKKLIKLRDSLLPKLMSGEIRVPIEEN